MDAKRLDRARGCIMGQLSGDALGSMVEFMHPGEIAAQYPGGLRVMAGSDVFGTIPGQPTDDSEMALALARTLNTHGFDIEATATAYAEWLRSSPFDVGNTTQQALWPALQALQRGEPVAEAARRAANRSSEANGALMRQSVLAIWGHSLPPERLAECIIADTELTHPSQVCRDVSCAYVIAVATAIRDGLNPEETYRVACNWHAEHGTSSTVAGALAEAARSKPADFVTHQGHVLIALQNAFYQALHAPSLEEGVVDTVMEGGDTDTNAAIAGALLGTIHGQSAIPVQWLETVLACKPETGLPGVKRPRPRTYWPADGLELAERLASRGDFQQT